MTNTATNNTHDDAIDTNPSDNPTFLSVLDARLTRRHVLKGGFSTTALAMFGGVGTLAGCSSGNDSNTSQPAPAATAPSVPTLGFAPVAKSLADVVAVPAGYSVSVLYRLGDPLAASVSDFRNDGTDPAASYAQRAGDHHDGMYFFGMGANNQFSLNTSDRGLLVMNHEAITPSFLHPNDATVVSGVRTVAEEVQCEFFVHGVSVIEVNRSGSTVTYNRASALNRRVHTLTEMELSGPAARTPLMITKFSPDGAKGPSRFNLNSSYR